MIPYRPKIFVSSTIYDLPNERTAALQAVQQLGADAIMSEFTINAQNNNSVNTCLEKVRSSDLYILILGGKYGWRPFNDKSITEMEYLAAQEKSIPILVFNTPYDKEDLQSEFAKRVGATFFWKSVADAFQLKDCIIESVKEHLDKQTTALKEKTEKLYSNLLRISFPSTAYLADLNLDRDEVIEKSKLTERKLKKSASWYDVTVAAIHQENIKFPHDWTCDGGQLLSFHDLSDKNLPLSKIVDLGTVTPLSCDEFYDQSEDKMRVFKSLLRNCLKTKLHKLSIRWYGKETKLFAFMPTDKDQNGKWKNREIEWTRKNKARRTVAKVTYGKKNPERPSSTRHLAFAANFYFIDNEWFVSIKPDWIITWDNDFKESRLGFEKIQFIKKEEKNEHVFNHLNFILAYLQPKSDMVMFDEYQEYKFLKIESFLTLDSWPIIHDDTWKNLESSAAKKKLADSSGAIDLFTT